MPPCEDILPGSKKSEVKDLLSELDTLARSAVNETLTNGTAIAFSSGLDSSILAALASAGKIEVSIFTVGVERSIDQKEAARNLLNLPQLVRKVSKEKVEQATRKVIELVNVSTLAHLEDVIGFHLIADELTKSGWKGTTIASANGPDELFCGYDKFRRILSANGNTPIKQEIQDSLVAASLLKKQVRIVLGRFGLELADPFLEENFACFCVERIPIEFKILSGEDRLRKRIWRVYGRFLRLPDSVVLKPKKAMQYSMGIHPIVFKMIRKKAIELEEEL